jgi:RNA polymerase sigma-70 factor (ECF subfamily)
MTQELIAGCIEGNRTAQRLLYEHFHPIMMGVCLRYAGNRDEALEIMNAGFLKVFRHIKKFDPEIGVLEAWVRRIITNTAIDHYRKVVRRERTADLDSKVHQIRSLEQGAVESLTTEEIMECVQKLSPAYRTVFNLYVVDGYSHVEIAKKLGISEGTSKSNLAKARMRLQQMLERMNRVVKQVEYALH